MKMNEKDNQKLFKEDKKALETLSSLFSVTHFFILSAYSFTAVKRSWSDFIFSESNVTDVLSFSFFGTEELCLPN